MSRRHLYSHEHWEKQYAGQLTLFKKPLELEHFKLHERINYRYNSKPFHNYDDDLYPYEQYVKAIRFGYSKSYICQFTDHVKL